MRPDDVVASLGENVVHSRVTAAVYDAPGAFSEAASTIATATIKAIVSQPSERQLPVRLQGANAFKLTVPSSTDVKSDRAGRPDRFTVRGILCEVQEVRDDLHPATKARKKTVLVAAVSVPSVQP
jgi:hypothetical protein